MSPKFLDRWFGAERTERAKPFGTKGTGGTVISGGVPQNNERNASLAGQAKFTTFNNVAINTAIVAAGIRHFVNLITKAGWKAQAVDDTPEAKRYAELAEQSVHQMETEWYRVIRQQAMFKFRGFSWAEWTMMLHEDGHLTFRDVQARPQHTIERWDVDSTGKVWGVEQRDPNSNNLIYIPRWKSVYMVDDTLTDSPEGIGLLRHVVESSGRLQRYLQLEGFGFETDLRGMPIGRAPLSELAALEADGTISAEDRTRLETPLKSFIRNHIVHPSNGIVLDSEPYRDEGEDGIPSVVKKWDLELLKAYNTSQEAVAAAIDRETFSIARIIGCEHLLLGGDSRGSHALSKDKTKSVGLAVASVLGDLTTTNTRDLIGQQWKRNGWPLKYRPFFTTDAIQHRDLEDITKSLLELSQAGATLHGEDEAINVIRRLQGLPDCKPVPPEQKMTTSTRDPYGGEKSPKPE